MKRKLKDGQFKIGSYTFEFTTGGKDFTGSVEFKKFWDIYQEQFINEQKKLNLGYIQMPDRLRAESEFNLILAVNGQSAEELTYGSCQP